MARVRYVNVLIQELLRIAVQNLQFLKSKVKSPLETGNSDLNTVCMIKGDFYGPFVMLECRVGWYANSFERLA